MSRYLTAGTELLRARDGAGAVAPFPGIDDLPPGPGRAEVVADMQRLKLAHAALIQQAKAKVTPGGTLTLADLQELPGWPAFVADLKEIYRLHADYFEQFDFKRRSSVSPLVVGGIGAVIVGAVLFLGSRRPAA